MRDRLSPRGLLSAKSHTHTPGFLPSRFENLFKWCECDEEMTKLLAAHLYISWAGAPALSGE